MSPEIVPNLGEKLIDAIQGVETTYNARREAREKIVVLTRTELDALQKILKDKNVSTAIMLVNIDEHDRLEAHFSILKRLKEKAEFFEKRPDTKALGLSLRDLYNQELEKHEGWKITLSQKTALALRGHLGLPADDLHHLELFVLGNGAYPPAIDSADKALAKRGEALQQRADKNSGEGGTDDELSLATRMFALSNAGSYFNAGDPTVGTPEEKAKKLKWREDTKTKWAAFYPDYVKYEKDCMHDGCQVAFKNVDLPKDEYVQDFYRCMSDLMKELPLPSSALNLKLRNPTDPSLTEDEKRDAQSVSDLHKRLTQMRQDWGARRHPGTGQWESMLLAWFIRNGIITPSFVNLVGMRARYEEDLGRPAASKSQIWKYLLKVYGKRIQT